MTAEPGPVLLRTDPLDLVVELPLTEDEAGYVEAARAPNTLRGYRSDWSEFTAWCTRHQLEPLPAGAATISGYLTELARAGAKVGTMSRRLSAIRFAHQLRDLPDPTTGARVVAVWEGIRRKHGAPPDQAKPLMPPQLLDVLAACPTTRTWKTRPAEPDLAGLRDRALLLVGFFTALRRSELSALTVDQLAEHPHGLVLALPRSRPTSNGLDAELVVLPRAGHPARCPVTALTTWLGAAAITDGPVLRPISKATGHCPATCILSRSTTWCGPPCTAPTRMPPATARIHCAPGSSLTPTCAAPPTVPSPTRPDTAPWPPSAPTFASRRPGPTTPPPSSGCSAVGLRTAARAAGSGVRRSG